MATATAASNEDLHANKAMRKAEMRKIVASSPRWMSSLNFQEKIRLNNISKTFCTMVAETPHLFPSITIKQNDLVTNATLLRLLGNSRIVRSIHLEYLPSITVAGLAPLVGHRHLRELHVINCVGIEGVALMDTFFRVAYQRLQIVKLEGTRNLKAENLATLHNDYGINNFDVFQCSQCDIVSALQAQCQYCFGVVSTTGLCVDCADTTGCKYCKTFACNDCSTFIRDMPDTYRGHRVCACDPDTDCHICGLDGSGWQACKRCNGDICGRCGSYDFYDTTLEYDKDCKLQSCESCGDFCLECSRDVHLAECKGGHEKNYCDGCLPKCESCGQMCEGPICCYKCKHCDIVSCGKGNCKKIGWAECNLSDGDSQYGCKYNGSWMLAARCCATCKEENYSQCKRCNYFHCNEHPWHCGCNQRNAADYAEEHRQIELEDHDAKDTVY